MGHGSEYVFNFYTVKLYMPYTILIFHLIITMVGGLI